MPQPSAPSIRALVARTVHADVTDRSRLWALGLVVSVVTALGVPAHATFGARAAVDEPQYLLTAISLGNDGDLDISDELAEEAYRPFHRVDLPRQTHPVGESAREVSPHDPLLPLLLAAPMRIGGWPMARATIAVMAGALAALTAWTAIRRFGVSHPVAIMVTGAFACSAPLATYATQVYPELPAALAAMAGVAGATAAPRWRSVAVVIVAVVALPWLSVKYGLVAASIAAAALWQWRANRRLVASGAGAFAVTAVAYLLAHRHLYGGWTSYASSGYFAEHGELSVTGDEPNYLGRTRRVVGLLVDDGFGIAMWMPAWLFAPVGIGLLWRHRPDGLALLMVPLAAGWFTATFVALTMHGWWWPGRQVVVVLPLAIIVVAAVADAVPRLRPAFAAAAAIGVVTWLWTTIEAIMRRHVLVADFERTGNPWVQLWRLVLPDGRTPTAGDTVLLAAWTVLLGASAGLGWPYADAGVATTPRAIAATEESRSGARGTKPIKS